MSATTRLAYLLAQAVHVLHEQERGGMPRENFFDRVDMAEDGWVDKLAMDATAAIAGGVQRNEAARKRRQRHTRATYKGMR